MAQTTNGQITKAFLESLDADTRNAILSSIAKHYEITNERALAEVTDDEAESLLDYLVEPVRSATSVLMQRRGFRGA